MMATLSYSRQLVGNEVQGDELRGALLQESFYKFRSSLQDCDKIDVVGETATEVLERVRLVDEDHRRSSTCRRAVEAFYPLVQFLDRHSRAVDCLTQVQPLPSAIIWAVCRILLEAAKSFATYFQKLVSMVERLNHSLALYQEYEPILSEYPRFQKALAVTYYNTLVFLNKARTVFTMSGFKLLVRSTWRTFETDFEDIHETILHNTALLREEATLAHRRKLYSTLESWVPNTSQSKNQDCSLMNATCTEVRHRIWEWLSPMDIESVLIRNQECRCPGSGQWLLNNSTFASWLDVPTPESHGLWVTAPPGHGKTILASVVVEEAKQRAQDPDTRVAYFFCHGRTQDLSTQALPAVFATLISQVIAEQRELPLLLTNAFQKAQASGRSKICLADHPVSLFRDILCSTTRKTFLVVDGLDEFSEGSELARSLTRLIQEVNNLRLLVLSRPMPVLNSYLSKLSFFRLTSDLMGRDVHLLIRHELADVEFGDEQMRCIILEKIYSQSNGMFLWAKLMVQAIKASTSPHDMLERIQHPPAGLEELYGSLLNAIAGQHDRTRRHLAKRVLLLTCCAARSLKWPELRCALAFDPQREALQWNHCKPFKTAVLESCNPLIEYLPANDTIRPIHTSVVDYITCNAKRRRQATKSPPEDGWVEEFCLDPKLAHLEMARLCVEYASADPGFVRSHLPDSLAFMEYATRFWCWHLGKAAYCPSLGKRIKMLLANRAKRQAWMARFLFSEFSQFPLQYSVKHGKILSKWLGNGGDIEAVEKESNVLIHWIQDTCIQEIFLKDGNTFHTTSTAKYLWGVAVDKIPYFDKLMVIRDLSREYTMAGRLMEGEARFSMALKAQQERLGKRHISCAALLNCVAIIFDQQKRYQCAKVVLEEALSIQESSLGPEHLEAIWTINELGRVHRHLGLLEKAEAMHIRALKMLTVVLPSSDLQIAWTRNTLGRTYRKQGRYAEAAELHLQALSIQKLALGENHPHCLWAMMDIAACYKGQGSLGESAVLYAEALERRVEVLGASHADTLWAMNDFGLVLEDLGDAAAALEMHREALRGQDALLGDNHKHTLWSRDVVGRLEEIKDGSPSLLSASLHLWAKSVRDQTGDSGLCVFSPVHAVRSAWCFSHVDRRIQ